MVDADTLAMIRGPADEAAIGRGCHFHEPWAKHVVEFFEDNLVHVKDWSTGRAGARFTLLDWQRDFLRRLFGWKRRDGTRRFRECYVEVPKKNGKSPLGAGIGLYLLGADGEAGAQVYCVASDKDQAGIVFKDALKMAMASDLFKNHVRPRETKKEIDLPSSNSFFRALSHEGFRNEGINMHGLLFDELHAQRTRELWDALVYSGASRRQPLRVSLTTAGYDRLSICYEQHDYAEKVLSGQVEDDGFLPLVYSAGRNDDWTSPDVWAKANPSLGVTVQVDELREACAKAQKTPAAENSFRRYRLNQWTEQETRWLSMDQWNVCAGAVNPEELRGLPCWAGLDLGARDDLSSLVLVFPRDDGRRTLLPFFWVPGRSIHEKETKDRAPYSSWQRAGLVEFTSQPATDYRLIRQRINDLRAQYDIREIAFDSWGADQVKYELAEDGIEMVEFRQSMANFAGPTKDFERLIINGLLEHGGNPVLTWMASNATVTCDTNGNYRPNKDAKREKIDGIVAAIMGLARCSVAVGEGIAIGGPEWELTVL